MKNRRHKLLINKQFQHSAALITVTGTVLMINIFIITAFLMADQFVISELGITNALLLAVFEGLAIGILYIIEIKMSHRVAGPIYVISRRIRMLGDGNLCFKMHLRKHDYFQEAVNEMNHDIDRLRERITIIKQRAKELEPLLETDSDARKVFEQLQAEIVSLITDANNEQSSEK